MQTFPAPEFTDRAHALQQHIRDRDEQRAHDHQDLLAFVQTVMTNYRADIGIEPYWTVESRICCPDEMSEAEACIWWDTDLWYARMLLRCDVPDPLVYNLVAHELYELLHWRTGECFRQLADHVQENALVIHLKQEHLKARNQEIEIEVQQFLSGMHRPYHLLGPYEYTNRHKRIATVPDGQAEQTQSLSSKVIQDRQQQRTRPVPKVQLMPYLPISIPVPIYDCPTGDQPTIVVRKEVTML